MEARGGGGVVFLKTPFLLRFLAYLAKFVPSILILPCDDRETDGDRPNYRTCHLNEFFDGMAISLRVRHRGRQSG